MQFSLLFRAKFDFVFIISFCLNFSVSDPLFFSGQGSGFVKKMKDPDPILVFRSDPESVKQNLAEKLMKIDMSTNISFIIN